jgi:hypothetical protein
MMNCEQIRDLLEAYALDALEPDERTAVETHLANCDNCRALAAQYAEVVDLLPGAVALASPLQPPAAAKQRLLAAVGAAPDNVGNRENPVPASIMSTNRHPQPRRAIPWRRLRTLGAVAAIVLLILGVVWIAQLQVALAEERELREDLEHQTELIFEVVDSDKTTRSVLLPLDYDPVQDAAPAYGKVFVRSDLPYVVAMTGRMPDAPAGEAYHLWLFGEAGPELAGTITVNEEGFGSLVYDTGRIGPSYAAAQIILQEEGSRVPDGTPILVTRD